MEGASHSLVHQTRDPPIGSVRRDAVVPAARQRLGQSAAPPGRGGGDGFERVALPGYQARVDALPFRVAHVSADALPVDVAARVGLRALLRTLPVLRGRGLRMDRPSSPAALAAGSWRGQLACRG